METLKKRDPRCISCLEPYTAMRLNGILYHACKKCGSTLIDSKDLSENFPDLFPAGKPLNYSGFGEKKCPACGASSRDVTIDKNVSAYSCECGKLSFEKDPLDGWFNSLDHKTVHPTFKIRFSVLFAWIGAAGIFYVSYYLTESVLHALIVLGVFGIPAILLIRWAKNSDLPEFHVPEDSKKPWFVHLWETAGALLLALLTNWPRVTAVVLIVAILWVSTKTMRAQTLKDIAIMIQPENQSGKASEAPGFFDRLGLTCDFSIAAYRTDPKVFQDWEIKAVQSICEASGDSRRWEKMSRYLPPIVEEDDPDDYDIRGSVAQAPLIET